MIISNPTAKLGEDLACKYFEHKGYKIIDRNFRVRNGEIDIVATFKNTLVFVEVKTRTSSKFGSPLEAITYYKLKSIVKTAQFYKITHRNLPSLMRIDAVSVDLSSQDPKIEHVENVSGF